MKLPRIDCTLPLLRGVGGVAVRIVSRGTLFNKLLNICIEVPCHYHTDSSIIL